MVLVRTHLILRSLYLDAFIVAELVSNARLQQALNCQFWIDCYIQRLVAEGYLSDSSITVVQQAPKRLCTEKTFYQACL